MGKRRKGKSRKKNPRKKNQETTVPILHKKKNNQLETRAPWADLPQDILGLILGKLLSTVDVIRFRAVCKSWHIDYKDDRNLPWLCNFSWSKKKPFLECEMYDPYSRQLFVTRKLVESRRYNRFFSKKIFCLGSKQGWLIAAYHNIINDTKWAIFMYHPYTKHFISLPFISKYHVHFAAAAFSGNPVSCNDCRVFLFMSTAVYPGDGNYIASCGLNGDKEWEIEPFDVGVIIDDDRFYNRGWCCGMQYMNEKLFCLFENGSMIRYNLADKSWTIIYLGEGSHQLAMNNQRLWLAQGEGDILVACEFDYRTTECWTFYFDWPSMSWVGSDLEESSAIFISSNIATFVMPIEDYDDVENNKGCKVYFFDKARCIKEPSGYAFAEIRKRGKPSFSTAFMEPPRINWS